MPLRWSIFGAIVGGAYVLSAAFLVSSEIHGNGCMGWCFALATFPEFFLLQALPTSYFYTSGWEHSIVWVFGAGAIGFNALILYALFGGLAWWGRDDNGE